MAGRVAYSETGSGRSASGPRGGSCRHGAGGRWSAARRRAPAPRGFLPLAAAEANLREPLEQAHAALLRMLLRRSALLRADLVLARHREFVDARHARAGRAAGRSACGGMNAAGGSCGSRLLLHRLHEQRRLRLAGSDGFARLRSGWPSASAAATAAAAACSTDVRRCTGAGAYWAGAAASMRPAQPPGRSDARRWLTGAAVGAQLACVMLGDDGSAASPRCIAMWSMPVATTDTPDDALEAFVEGRADDDVGLAGPLPRGCGWRLRRPRTA